MDYNFNLFYKKIGEPKTNLIGCKDMIEEFN